MKRECEYIVFRDLFENCDERTISLLVKVLILV